MLHATRHEAALIDESGRVCALQRYNVLDTEPEPGFQKITSVIKTIFDVPIAAVSLIERASMVQIH